ncbi:hypothetical protein IVB42_02620 [Bradyrhizobium sp. 45]|nr:hypothetical protein [Bradyrhizobium sp. 45]
MRQNSHSDGHQTTGYNRTIAVVFQNADEQSPGVSWMKELPDLAPNEPG